MLFFSEKIIFWVLGVFVLLFKNLKSDRLPGLNYSCSFFFNKIIMGTTFLKREMVECENTENEWS